MPFSLNSLYVGNTSLNTSFDTFCPHFEEFFYLLFLASQFLSSPTDTSCPLKHLPQKGQGFSNGLVLVHETKVGSNVWSKCVLLV